MPVRKTIVGNIHPEVLVFTAGKDTRLDLVLTEADCIATAAHVTMLSRMPVQPPLFTEKEKDRVLDTLVHIMRRARRGDFVITQVDQDVHLAVERVLTQKLGTLGKRVHTGRSRNDQIAVDLRLFAKEQLLCLTEEVAALAGRLLLVARRWLAVPMVGRTHLQPAMPSSVGLWASGYAESLLDDLLLVTAAYQYNDRCPLGFAAGYGVPLPIDRKLTARLLGFEAAHHNVFHAGNTRGKCEAVILGALTQVMLTLSRLAEDLIIFSTPEFGYFTLPAEYGTGSSIMPQKNNPDVLELVRAKASVLIGQATAVAGVVSRLPGGYNRDLQETKEPFLEGLAATRASLRILALVAEGLKVNRQALLTGFGPEVFAADRALELVSQGRSFRDAYDHVKTHLEELRLIDPREAVARKTHWGAPGGLDLGMLNARAREATAWVHRQRGAYGRAVSRLFGRKYPSLCEEAKP